jgi:hypothetical protein
MSENKFDKPQRSRSAEAYPSVPKHCLDPDCEDLANVAIAVVDVNGRRRSGPFGLFAHSEHGVLKLNSNVDFVRWETYCARCYDLHVLRHKACSNPFNPYTGKLDAREVR